MNLQNSGTLLNSRPLVSVKSLVKASLAVVTGLQMIAAPPAWGGGSTRSYEIDINELKRLKTASPAKKPMAKAKHAAEKGAESRTEPGNHDGSKTLTYTVRSGDHLFKILVRNFGLSHRDAELLIPEIISTNGLSSSSSLSVGQKLVINLGRHKPQRKQSGQSGQQQKVQAPKVAEPDAEIVATTAEPPKEIIQPAAADTAPPQEMTPVALSSQTAPPAETAAQDTDPQTAAQETTPLTIVSVIGADSGQLVDGIFKALALQGSRDRVIEGSTGQPEGERFSIKVERYLEFRNNRYVINRNTGDPFAYTMLRLLETAGYRIILINGQADFMAIGSQLLTKLEIPFAKGRYRFTPPREDGPSKELNGFMITMPGSPWRIFLTETPLDSVSAEQLSSFTVEALPL